MDTHTHPVETHEHIERDSQGHTHTSKDKYMENHHSETHKQ